VTPTITTATGALSPLNGYHVEFVDYGTNRRNCRVKIPDDAPLYAGKVITVVTSWLTEEEGQ
jgi:hypothetical protein